MFHVNMLKYDCTNIILCFMIISHRHTLNIIEYNMMPINYVIVYLIII